MPALAELQRAMAQSLFASDAATRSAPLVWFRDTAAARDGLHVHRNTVIGACWNALRLSYPALERWLGEAAFEALAADYARAQPPVAAALTAYGESFADFVAARVNDADRALACDIARFDWAFERAAQRAPGFDGAPDHSLQPGVRLVLAASLRLHAADFAVDELRERLLGGESLPAALPLEPGHWALWRAPGGVAVRRLRPASFALLGALLAGAGIDAALQSAGAAHDSRIGGAADDTASAADVLASDVLQAGFARVSLSESDLESTRKQR